MQSRVFMVLHFPFWRSAVAADVRIAVRPFGRGRGCTRLPLLRNCRMNSEICSTKLISNHTGLKQTSCACTVADRTQQLTCSNLTSDVGNIYGVCLEHFSKCWIINRIQPCDIY